MWLEPNVTKGTRDQMGHVTKGTHVDTWKHARQPNTSVSPVERFFHTVFWTLRAGMSAVSPLR